MKMHNELLELRKKEKLITGQIIEALQKLESKRIYLDWGYSSLFDYLVRGLKYSETTAYQRQACIRLSRDLPEIKSKIDEGKLTFSSLATAYKHIRNKPIEEKKKIIRQIENQPARAVKKMLAPMAPDLKVKEAVYQDKVILKIELSPDNYKKYKKLLALKSHNEENLFSYLVDKELKMYGKTNFRPTKSANPRQISQRLRNHVLKRAGYRCQHKNCDQTHYLQIDHIIPVRNGGKQSAENLQVLCSAHNQRKA